jgi:hypothetical protein
MGGRVRSGGVHLDVLRWARARGCPWSGWTSRKATVGGPFCRGRLLGGLLCSAPMDLRGRRGELDAASVTFVEAYYQPHPLRMADVAMTPVLECLDATQPCERGNCGVCLAALGVGDWSAKDCFGRGSYGEVRAFYSKADACRAVKRLTIQNHPDLEAAWLETYATTVAGNAGIALPLESASQDGTDFALVMPCACMTLTGFIRTSRFLEATPGDVTNWVDQLRTKVAALHEAGIAHGDLKASNILLKVDAYGDVQLYLADFGLAVLEPDARACNLTATSSLKVYRGRAPAYLHARMGGTIGSFWDTTATSGIAHGNLKESKILLKVDEHGDVQLYLADFPLACNLTGASNTNADTSSLAAYRGRVPARLHAEMRRTIGSVWDTTATCPASRDNIQLEWLCAGMRAARDATILPYLLPYLIF